MAEAEEERQEGREVLLGRQGRNSVLMPLRREVCFRWVDERKARGIVFLSLLRLWLSMKLPDWNVFIPLRRTVLIFLR